MYQEELRLPALSSAIECGTDTRQPPGGTDTHSDSVTGTEICKASHTQKQKKKRTDGTNTVKILSTDIHTDHNLKAPGLSYIALISMAIQSSASKKMLLSEIYHWISENYPYYQMKDKSWRNSIRHNLSLNECFVKNGRSENGKGNYWSIHPANIDDFSKGDYRRRRARRQVRKCDEDLKRLCSSSPESVKAPTPTSAENGCHGDGYVPMASTLVPSNFLSAIGVDAARSYDYLYSNLYAQSEDCKKSYNSDYKYASRTDMAFTGSDVPYYGRCYSRDSPSLTPSPTESTVNVNVNVNVCGTSDSNRQERFPYADRLCNSAQPPHYGNCWSDSYDQPSYYC